MADKDEKNTCANSQESGKYRGLFSQNWLNPRVLTPAIVYAQRKREAVPPVQPTSLWERLGSWIRYYGIQWRWAIERKVARLLHRSWVG